MSNDQSHQHPVAELGTQPEHAPPPPPAISGEPHFAAPPVPAAAGVAQQDFSHPPPVPGSSQAPAPYFPPPPPPGGLLPTQVTGTSVGTGPYASGGAGGGLLSEQHTGATSSTQPTEPLGSHPPEPQQFQPPPQEQSNNPFHDQAHDQYHHDQAPYDQPHHDHPPPDYTIPPYDPAHPTFAQPPRDEKPPIPNTDTAPPPIPSAPVPSAGESSGVGAAGAAAAIPSSDLAATADPTPQQPKKKGWFASIGEKAAAKLGSPGFLPQSLDKECHKTADIIKAFCKNGVYADPGASEVPGSTDPKKQKKNRTLVTIPPKVIARAVGLAIFTSLRAGFQVTGALGSGILIARKDDGSWGPPSAISVISMGGGFQLGIDMMECICVINTKEALKAFSATRLSLGGDMAISAGPYGAGGAVEIGSNMGGKGEEERRQKQKEKENATNADPAIPADNSTLQPERPSKDRRSSSSSLGKPVFSYVKSRGFYAGVQVDGTIIVERKDANAAYYGKPIPVENILKGEVPPQGGMWPAGATVLHDVLKGAEAGVLQQQQERSLSVGPSRQGTGLSSVSATPAAGPSNSAQAPPVPGSGAIPIHSNKAEQPVQKDGPPIYEDAPPAYVEDGTFRADVGDHKRQQ